MAKKKATKKKAPAKSQTSLTLEELVRIVEQRLRKGHVVTGVGGKDSLHVLVGKPATLRCSS